jgi:uncharacterized membrane protein
MSAYLSMAPIGPLPATAWRLRFGRQAGATMHWQLKRNCSIAPRQLLGLYASFCLLSLAIAGAFWLKGVPLVMPFAGLELVAVGAALLAYARHAADRETIRLIPGELLVQRVCGAQLEEVAFAPSWVRVEPQTGDRSLIELSGQGRQIAVGRYVRPELRRALADELRWALRRWQGRAPAADESRIDDNP